MPKITFNAGLTTYSELSVLGNGGAGRVYLAVDNDGQQVAIKCLLKHDTEKRKRFKNELFFGYRVKHKHIISVLDHGTAIVDGKSCPFYAMPYFASTLRKLIQSRIPHDKVLLYFGQILSGVQAAHQQGTWHRDLKPENVLYDPNQDCLVIADFGVAHFTEEYLQTTIETESGDRLANFQYAAPEQRQKGADVDQRADIFALGLILNELFTGEVRQGSGYKTIGGVAPEYAFLDLTVDLMVRQSPDGRPNSIEMLQHLLVTKGSNAGQGTVPGHPSQDNATIPSWFRDLPTLSRGGVEHKVVTCTLLSAKATRLVGQFVVIRNASIGGGLYPYNNTEYLTFAISDGETSWGGCMVKLDTDLEETILKKPTGHFYGVISNVPSPACFILLDFEELESMLVKKSDTGHKTLPETAKETLFTVDRLSVFGIEDEGNKAFGKSQFSEGLGLMRILKPYSYTEPVAASHFVILAAIPVDQVSVPTTEVKRAARTMLEKWYDRPKGTGELGPKYYPHSIFQMESITHPRSTRDAVYCEEAFPGSDLLLSRLAITGLAETTFLSANRFVFIKPNGNDGLNIFLAGNILAECWRFSGLTLQLHRDIGYFGKTALCIGLVDTLKSHLGKLAEGFPDPLNEQYGFDPHLNDWSCHSRNLRFYQVVDLATMKSKEQPDFIEQFAEDMSQAYNHGEIRSLDQDRRIPSRFLEE